jgi:hypothetical protein
MIEVSQKTVKYKIGEIVRYTRYENDLVNEPNKKPTPNNLLNELSGGYFGDNIYIFIFLLKKSRTT